MRVNELYSSVQGEGLLTGMPSVLVRLAGCPLRCAFCDTTAAAWDAVGTDETVDSILQQIERFPIRHVILTGGEPMIYKELVELTDALGSRGYHITIETAGVRDLPVRADLISISPKMLNSRPDPNGPMADWVERHESARHCPEIVRSLIDRYDYQLKFVVAEPSDCEEVEEYLKILGRLGSKEIRRDRVFLMPEGVDPRLLESRATWLEPYCRENQFQYCPRRHIEWFGKVRGT
jgi:7-carboxy-7-deazaguanine synthase